MPLVYTRGEFCDDAALALPSPLFLLIFRFAMFHSPFDSPLMAEGCKSLLMGGESSY